jgi:hypothetical protein
MKIEIVEITKVSDHIERCKVNVSKDRFCEFGFFLETMEGVGIHRRSYETENLMEVDISIGFKDDFIALINDLQSEQ